MKIRRTRSNAGDLIVGIFLVVIAVATLIFGRGNTPLAGATLYIIGIIGLVTAGRALLRILRHQSIQ